MEDVWIERYRFKNKPFAHQQKYLSQYWKRPVAALFADMGTGKSFIWDGLPEDPDVTVRLMHQMFCHVPEGQMPDFDLLYRMKSGFELTLWESL